MAAITCFADEISEDYQSNCEGFAEIIRDRVRQGKSLQPADYAFALSHLGYDERKANREYRDMKAAMGLLAIIGTPEQELAGEEELRIAREVVAKEVPKHRAKAEEHTSKADAAERALRLAEKRVQDRREAWAKLPGFASEYLKKEVADEETRLSTEGIGVELRHTEARLQELRSILNIDNCHKDQQRHLEYGLQTLLPAAVVKGLRGSMITRSYSPEWPSLKAGCEQEFAELNQRLPERQAAFDEALAIVRKPLVDFFMKEND